MDKKYSEKLGFSFELGFKEGLINLLPEELKIKELKRNEIKNLDSFVQNRLKNILNLGLYEDLEIKDYKARLKNFQNLKEIGNIASTVYIKEMLFKEKTFNPIFPKPLFEVEESITSWKNADILFIQDKTLYIFELTLLGGAHIHEILSLPKINNQGIIELSLGFDGLNIYVGYEKEDLIFSADKLLSGIKTKEPIILTVKEYGKLAQLMFYLFDFLHNTDYKINEVYLSIIYPFKEGLNAKFKISNIDKDIFKEYANRFKKVRELLKPNRLSIRKNRFLIGTEKIINKLNSEKIILSPKYAINEVRKDVEKIVNEHSNNFGEVIALCHSAGAGKTTSILKDVVNLAQKENVLFFYFSPRRAITKDKYEDFKKQNKEKNLNAYVIYNDDIADEKNSYKYKKHKRIVYSSDQKQKKGIINKFYNKIKFKINNYNHIAIFSSLQALMQANKNKYQKIDTIKHLKNIIYEFRYKKKDNYKVIIVLDEILADNTGLFKIKEILQALKEFKDKTKIYLLDANLLNGYILEKLLYKIEEMKKQNIDYLPSSIYEIKGKELIKEFYEFYFEDWKFKTYTKPSFIGKNLSLNFRLEFFNSEKDLIESFIEILKNEKEQYFVYIQDKDLAKEIEEKLKTFGKKVALRTAYHENLDTKEISKYDVVIGTSSISRGIDVPFKKIYGFFYEFSSEQEIAEFYQALSRMRGMEDENGKNIDKFIEREATVLLFRTIPKNSLENEDFSTLSKEKIYKKIKTLQLLGLKNLIVSSLEAYINPKENKTYFIAFPEIKEPKEPKNEIQDIKQLMEIAKLLNESFEYKLSGIVDSKNFITIYPFRIYINSTYTIEIKKKYLNNLKKKIEKFNKLAKKKDYINTIETLLNYEQFSNFIRVKLDNLPVVEYLPFKIYNIKPTNKVKFVNKYITRKNLKIAGTNPLVELSDEGKLLVILADIPNEKINFIPKIPIEIFFDESKLL